MSGAPSSPTRGHAEQGHTRRALERGTGDPQRDRLGDDRDRGQLADAFASLQSSAGNQAVHSLLPSSSAAMPLPSAVRSEMEQRFQFDFGGVQLHTGAGAARSAEALRAKAFTVGRDIVFSEGRFAPESRDGRRLLAHELAHVVQQSRGGAAPALNPAAPHEVAARSTADAVVGGAGPVSVPGGTGIGIAREEEDEKKKAASAAKDAEPDDIDAAFDAMMTPKGKSRRSKKKPNSRERRAAIEREQKAQPGEERKDAPLMKEAKGRGIPARRAAGTQGFQPYSPAPAPGGMATADYNKATKAVRQSQSDADVAHFGRVVHGDAPMTPEEMYRTIISLRGFDNSLGVGQIDKKRAELSALETAAENAPDKDEVTALREERRKLKDKLARRKRAAAKQTGQASPGAKPATKTQPTDHEAIEGRIAEIEKKLGSTPTDKQRKQAATLQKKLAISTGERGGAEAGLGDNTYVVIQIVGKDGRVIARVAARNDRSGHAEQNAIPLLEKQLNAIYPSKDPKKPRQLPEGARVEVMGDQIVCSHAERCRPALTAFATKYGAASVVGMTYHEKKPGVTSDEPKPDELASEKTTAMRATKKGSATEKGAAKPGDLHLREETLFTAPPTSAAGGQKQGQPGAISTGKKHADPGAVTKSSAEAAPGGAKKDVPPKKDPKKHAETQANKQAVPKAPAATKSPAAESDTPTPPSPKPAKQKPAAPAQAPAQAKAAPPAPAPPKPAPPKPAPKPPAAQAKPAPPAPAPPQQAPKPPAAQAKPPKAPAAPKPAAKGAQPGQTNVPKGGPKASSTSVGSGAMATSPGTALAGPPGNVGASRAFNAQAVQSHGKGVKTFQNIGGNGRVAIETTELANMTPTQYRTTVTITLGGQAGGGASRQSEDPKGGIGGSASVHASGSVTATFSHVLNAEETQKYLAALKSGSGGAQKELQVIQLATANQIEEARTLLSQQSGKGGLAAVSKNMSEGDVVSLDTEGTVGGELGVSGSRGRAGVGVQAGAHATSRVGRSIARHGGKDYVTVTVASEKGKSLGGSMSYMGLGMGHTAHGSEGQTESITFELDPKDSNYQARLAEIAAASTADDLRKLAARQRPVSQTTGKEETSGGVTELSAGPIAFRGMSSGTYGEEETRTPEGISRTYTGTGSSGAELAAGKHTLAKVGKTDTIATTVGPDKKARGVTSSTERESDWGLSLQRLAASAEDRPGGTAVGVATGETKVLQEKVHTQGAHLSDDSYARLAELAKNPGAWQKEWSGNVDTFIAWEATRKKVLAANGDRDRIAKALAEFGSGGSGRSATVEGAVGGTGVAFEFPQSVAQHKPVYDTFVAGDALAHPRELAAAGHTAEALAELNDIAAKLFRLSQEISMHGDDFEQPAKLAEMMGRISTRSAELRAEIRKISAPPSPGAAEPAPSSVAVKPAPGTRPAKVSPQEQEAAAKAEEARRQQAEREEQNQKREERNAKINLLVPLLMTLQQKEQTAFAKANEEMNSWFKSVATVFAILNKIRDSWPQWDARITELRAVYQERGESPDRADQFAPNRSEWQRLNSIAR